jgi:hypothetical protein
MFHKAIDGIEGVRDDLQGEPLLDHRFRFVDSDDFCCLVRLQITGGLEGSVSVVIWAKVYSTATPGIVFTVVEAGAICVDGDGMGMESDPLGVVALGWDCSKTLRVHEDMETFC